ncbi:DHA2 family efflux MFS transporter permease subunit [Streptomyces sp. NPDC014734]|uniref:DHA2 family efflux MFS transporter permease subunit n=1 Tax=Streptomyces sp. NPDC014734 TaxID=3364886 RepID=UPI0036FD5B57
MTSASEKDKLDPALRKLMGILIIGIIAVLLDTTIVNVAINTLRQELNVSVSTIQWVNTGYLLALGMVIPLTAWTVARFGAKRMWLFSLTLFLVGSVLSGMAWDINSLIGFRVLQGIGGGLMFPILQTLLLQAAGAQRVGRLMAVVGMPAVVVPILGPVAGGLIISNASWRWIFLINIPICLIGLVLAWRGLPESPGRSKSGLDVLGLVLLSPALAGMLYGLSQVGARGGFAHASVIVPVAAGLILLAAFIRHALRSDEPVVDVRLFQLRSFTGSGVLLFISGLSLYGVMMLLPLYYQQVGGHSALKTGLLLVPQGVGSLLTRGPAGRLTDKLGPRPVVLVGMTLTVLGIAAYTQAAHSPNFVVLSASLVVLGAGLGAATVSVMTAAFQGLQPGQIPHASSATRILQQVGGSFGTAVLAVILQWQLSGHTQDAAGRAAAFGNTFWWVLGFAAVSVAPAMLLPHRARRPQPQGAVPAEATGESMSK